MATLTERVVEATRGRDRVLDAAKAVALLLVVVAHSLAWHITPEREADNVLTEAPGLVVLTWLFQVLPLFFAAGAVANLASWRRHGTGRYLLRRGRRLVTPVLIYASVWTVALAPFSLLGETIVGVGKFLAQLLWFAGVYLFVSILVPVTARWRSRPWLTVGLWLVAVAGVDLLRIAGAPEAVGWVNFLLVWGLLHQIGYHLPQLRRANRLLLSLGAVAGFATAVSLAAFGPYAMSMVTVSSDTELSNLSPPSLVLAAYGTGQILMLAAVSPTLESWLSRPRVWTPIALFGARGFEVYLWHIPLVGIAAGLALALSWSVPALGVWWWLVHLAVVVTVVPCAWLLAGPMGRLATRLARAPGRGIIPAGLGGGVAALLVLHISVTGFATWWGAGALGLPGSSLLTLGLLWLVWWGSGARSPRMSAGV